MAAGRIPGGLLVRRAFRLRCPLCGEGPLFAGWVRMHERCSGCGFKFEREAGYFLGSIYVNYGSAVLLALALHFMLAYGFRMPIARQFLVIAPVTAAVGFLGFRWSRALWMAVDVGIDPPENPREP